MNINNILVVEPKPRNPILADALKRIGLAERTGRGVDLIYQGLLRYGRPEPDYSRSDINTVFVRLSSAAADVDFFRMILEAEERSGTSMPIDALIVLARLRKERRLSVSEAAKAIQKDESAARGVLEQLTESGLVEAHGVKKGRTYTLSAKVYRTLGQESRYVRQAGFDPIQQEQMVMQYIRKHGQMKRQDAIDLCHIGPFQATRLFDRLVKAGKLERQGKKRGSYYILVKNKRI